jgi:hypothetical protein
MRKLAAADDKWIVEESALDETCGAVTFNVFAGEQLSSIHRPNPEMRRFERDITLARQIKVTTTTLKDELLRYEKAIGFRRPFLKMDTQGHDLSVARSAGDEIRKFVGLQSELSIKRIYLDSPNIWDALTFYYDCGFELTALVPNNAGYFPELIEIDCIMHRPDPSDNPPRRLFYRQ